VFQPHGFGPTKFMRGDLIEMFSEKLRRKTFFTCREYFTPAASAERSFLRPIIMLRFQHAGANAFYYETERYRRSYAAERNPATRRRDGARATHADEFCRTILSELRTK